MSDKKYGKEEKEHANRPWWQAWWVILIGGLLLLGLIFMTWWPRIAHAHWEVMNGIMQDMQWPFVVLVSILVLNRPLGNLFQNLGESLGRMKSLKIGDKIYFTADEVVENLVEREKLKVGILIANATDGIGPEEANHLANLADTLPFEVHRLSRAQREQVLKEAINVALVDDAIQEEEYVRLKEFADKYNQGREGKEIIDVDLLIAQACYHSQKTNDKITNENKKKTPPPQLTKYYAKIVKQWKKEKQDI